MSHCPRRLIKSSPPYYLVFLVLIPVLIPDKSQTQLQALSFLHLPQSARGKITRLPFLWQAPKSAQRKDPSASRSQSLSSTKRWRTIGRLLRTERLHDPYSGPFVLLGPSGPLRNGLCTVCKLLILYPPWPTAPSVCAIITCMLFPSGLPFMFYL